MPHFLGSENGRCLCYLTNYFLNLKMWQLIPAYIKKCDKIKYGILAYSIWCFLQTQTLPHLNSTQNAIRYIDSNMLKYDITHRVQANITLRLSRATNNPISNVCRLGGICTHAYQLLAYKRSCVMVPVTAKTTVT